METARAMSIGASLVLTDEPTASLDWSIGARVAEALMATTATGAALVVCTHDERLAAMCDESLRLASGRLSHAPQVPL